MTRAAALLVVLSAATLTGQAQSPARDTTSPSPPSATVAIRGRVVTADTGDPVPNARVGVAGDDGVAPVLTDSGGSFMLPGVRAGARELSAAKTGYVTTSSRAVDGVELRLTKGAAITGRVLDDLGAPLPLVTVVAGRILRGPAGGIHFDPMTSAETDDLGEYRLFGLPAGNFAVATAGARIVPPGSTSPVVIDSRAAPHHYYPRGDALEEAESITLAAGVEATGIDFTVVMPSIGGRLAEARGVGSGGTGVIRGRVARTDGIPVRAARVQLESADGAFTPYLTPTDDQGRYGFRGLSAGTYRVSAMSLNGAAVAFGQRRPSERGEPMTLKPGATLEGIDITMPQPSAISGRIVDERGDPMALANVRVERIEFSKGRRRLSAVPGIASRQTNDLGRYRIFGLAPGRYLVSAVVGEKVPGWETADWPGYARTYSPGTPIAAEAQTIEVAWDQSALNVDFSLVRGRVARIAGAAYTANGQPLHAVVALTQSYRSGALGTPPVTVRTGDDGRFEFPRLAPGEYVIQASTTAGSVYDEGEFAARFVTVDGVDVAGLTLHLSEGSTLAGRLTFENIDPPDNLDLRLFALPTDPDLASLVDNLPGRAEIQPDRAFLIRGLQGPRRLGLPEPPVGWMLKSVIAGGIDVTDTPLAFGTKEQSRSDVEVVMTNRITQIGGTVADERGGPARDAAVVAFAANRDLWYAGSRFVGHADVYFEGTFDIPALAPGDYYVAVVENRRVLDVGTEIQNPEFLESLVAGATKVSLAEDQRVALQLKLVTR